MKKSLLVAGALATCTALSANTFAQGTHGQRYVGASVGFMELDFGNTDASLNHFEGRLGGYVNDYLAAEGRVGLGVVGDEIGPVDIDLRYLVGGYLRAGAPLADNKLFPYVLLGFTRADVEVGNVSDAETDASLGFGADVELEGLSLSIEYVEYVDKNEYDLSGFNIGLKTNF